MFKYFGVNLDEDKRKRMKAVQSFLGLLNDLARLPFEHHLVFGCRSSTRVKALTLLTLALQTDSMTPAQASKIRGVVTWLDTGLYGRPCRGLLGTFTARQYWEESTNWQLTSSLKLACLALQSMVQDMPDRMVNTFRRLEPPLIMYTDAAAQDRSIRLGLLLMKPHVPALCFSIDVPAAVVDAWAFRTQYIGQGELLAGPLALHVFQHELLGKSLIWFIDNQASLTAMLKGSSPVQDNSAMALIAAMQIARYRVSCWFEFVDSKANPSDPLSRGGYEDPDVSSQLARGTWQKIRPRRFSWTHLIRSDVIRLKLQVSALGGL